MDAGEREALETANAACPCRLTVYGECEGGCECTEADPHPFSVRRCWWPGHAAILAYGRAVRKADKEAALRRERDEARLNCGLMHRVDKCPACQHTAPDHWPSCQHDAAYWEEMAAAQTGTQIIKDRITELEGENERLRGRLKEVGLYEASD